MYTDFFMDHKYEKRCWLQLRSRSSAQGHPRKWGVICSAPVMQSLRCFWRCLFGDRTKPAHYLGNLEQPQQCLLSASHGSALTPGKEKTRGRCTPNLVFCIALCKGSHIKPCRHLRACQYLGVAQELELGEELCFGCKFTAVFYGEEKSSRVLFRAQVSSCTDVGQLQRECNLRAFPSASTSIWAEGLPGASLG